MQHQSFPMRCTSPGRLRLKYKSIALLQTSLDRLSHLKKKNNPPSSGVFFPRWMSVIYSLFIRKTLSDNSTSENVTLGDDAHPLKSMVGPHREQHHEKTHCHRICRSSTSVAWSMRVLQRGHSGRRRALVAAGRRDRCVWKSVVRRAEGRRAGPADR